MQPQRDICSTGRVRRTNVANHLAFSALGAPEDHAAWHELTIAVLLFVASRSALADAMIVCKMVVQAPLYV